MKWCAAVILLSVGLALAQNGFVHMTHRGPKRPDAALASNEQLLFDFLMAKSELGKASRLGSFEFKNCGDPKTEVGLVNQLTLSPDPLPTKGMINVSFQAEAKVEVGSPIQASLVVKKEVLGTWIKIPCIGEVGSCNYSDLCTLLQKITKCPDPLTAHHIPCHCPFPAGNYTLPNTGFDIDLSIIPKGSYSAAVNITTTKAFVGCYEVQFTFE